MPHVVNQGVRIHYEMEGSGPPLVLQHGTLGSSEDWKDFGYVDALKGDYRLILIDARGHGASDKPHEPAAYDLALRAGDVTTVLDDLQIHQANYFGYSMGGWIGFGLAKYAPGRFKSMVLGGAHPYAENMQAFRDLMPREPQAFLAMMESVWGSYMTQAIRTRAAANDLEAALALTQDRGSMAEILSTMTMPCLLFVGEADPRFSMVQECIEQLPNGRLFSLPKCGHVDGFARSDLVLPHVVEFLAKAGQ
jgi:pimeloyl-ACP methyl ester carboxylesterase